MKTRSHFHALGLLLLGLSTINHQLSTASAQGTSDFDGDGYSDKNEYFADTNAPTRFYRVQALKPLSP